MMKINQDHFPIFNILGSFQDLFNQFQNYINKRNYKISECIIQYEY